MLGHATHLPAFPLGRGRHKHLSCLTKPSAGCGHDRPARAATTKWQVFPENTATLFHNLCGAVMTAPYRWHVIISDCAYRLDSANHQIGVCRTCAGAPLASPGGKLSPKPALRNRFWGLMRNGEIFQLPVQCVKKHHIGTRFVQLMRICSCSCRRSSSTASRSPFPPGEGICSVPQTFKHQFTDLLSQADKYF